MADIELVIDLAIIMLVAAGVTLLFSWLKQPLILGYLIAGMIIGPNLQPFQIVTDTTLITYIAELGIVLLMFTLGLEFTLGRLKDIGLFALAIGTIEILLMIGVGFWTGRLLGFPESGSLILGAVMGISSTAVIIKSLQEFGLVAKQHAQIIIGVLVVEDVAAVIMIALISGFGGVADATFGDVLQIIFSMILFLIASIAIGILFIPRMISRIARKRPTEVLLLVSLGLCFGFSVVSAWLGFSLAIGAFIAGMLIGESEDVDLVVLKTTPIREMFVAVFFVTMGMMFNPNLLPPFLLPVLVILLLFTLGKTFLVGTGSFLFGFPAKTAFLAGSGMIALGEFSFIICRAGVDAGMAEEYLYSIIVLVATITAFTLPVSVKNGERMFSWLSRHTTPSIKATVNYFQGSLVSVRSQTKHSPEVTQEWRRRSISSIVDVAIVAIIAIASRTLLEFRDEIGAYINIDPLIFGIILFIATAALIIPPIFHLARNIKSMIELVVRHSPAISGNSIAPMSNLRKALEGIVISIIALLLLFIALPLAIDTQLHETVSPAVFIAAIGIIVFLAWYLNKTVYRAFSEHVQRDLIKERVTVGKDTRAEQSVAADEDLKKREKPLFLEGKDE